MHCDRSILLPRQRFSVPVAIVWLCALSGCVATMRAGRRTAESPYTLWVGPFAVRTLQPLDEDGTEAQALRTVAVEIDKELGKRPVHDPIEVFLFADRERYEQFLREQGSRLPYRRALFVRDGARRMVYAYRSGRIGRDLKHEATHALLSARCGSVALWLDEGLAEYFEADAAEGHLQPAHVRELAAQRDGSGWRPDIRRLAAKKHTEQFTRRDYAEAWLWCHFLLRSSEQTKQWLIESLERDGGRELANRLASAPGLWQARLLQHLAALESLLPP